MTPPRAVEEWTESCCSSGHVRDWEVEFPRVVLCDNCARAYAAEQVAQARAEEREACATLVSRMVVATRREIAAAIRART